MRRSVITLAVFVFLGLLLPSGSQASTIVKLADSKGFAATLTVTSPEGVAGWKYLPAVDLYIVEESGRDRLNRLQKEGAIEAAEEGFDIQLESLPNDPLLMSQGWVGDKGLDVGAAQAWGLLGEEPGITIAVIDTGIDTRHPDLAPNLWTNPGEIAGNGRDDDGNGFIDDVNGYNFWDGSSDVTDKNNHGSHLAGIIGAVGDNGLGVAGVDWNARLMALRFTDEKGNGTSAKAIEAIDYAIRNGAKIINASWTLKFDDGEVHAVADSDLLRQAIQKASEAGVLFVTASGNQFQTGKGLDIDDSPVYPAAFHIDNMVTVAAVDSNGLLATYSNFGRETIDLAAPGTSILSTSADGDYISMSGTSMATAFVSGAAALVYSMDPTLTPAQVKAVLSNSVTPSPSLEGKVATGGILNLFEAVSVVQSGTLPETPPTSVSSGASNETGAFTDTSSATSSAGGCSLIP